jgi:hypothetical protein
MVLGGGALVIAGVGVVIVDPARIKNPLHKKTGAPK